MSGTGEFPLSDSEMFQQSPGQGVAVLASSEGDADDHDSGLSFDPDGDVQIALASQEAADDARALLQQAADGIVDPRE